jgi:hypothetical protein
LSLESNDWCRYCIPPEARWKIFQLRLPVATVELIKQKHGNVSKYLRELIARDLGEDAFPAAALKRPGRKPARESDLKLYPELCKPIHKRGKLNGNSTGDYFNFGRIRSTKKRANKD